MSYINVLTFNGLANRLNAIISALRLAKKSNRTLHISWLHTPVRSCLEYIGDFCNFEDIFKVEGFLVNSDDKLPPQFEKNYEFQYWLEKDHIIDIKGTDNIFINYALYTLVSTEDNSDSIFVNLKKYISEPHKVEFDYIGEELADILRNDLKPIDELQTEIDKYHIKFYPNMIGIHVRNSDGGFSKYDWKGIVDKLLVQCKNWCNKNKDNGVYLATDDPEIFIKFASKLGSKLIFYDPPECLANTRSTSSGKFNNDKYNVLCAVVELYLLGKCNKYLIGTADSTFSFCGMLMTSKDTQKYLVNAPENVPEF